MVQSITSRLPPSATYEPQNSDVAGWRLPQWLGGPPQGCPTDQEVQEFSNKLTQAQRQIENSIRIARDIVDSNPSLAAEMMSNSHTDYKNMKREIQQFKNRRDNCNDDDPPFERDTIRAYLMAENDFTEEGALFDEIERRQREAQNYQAQGFSTEDALKLAGLAIFMASPGLILGGAVIGGAALLIYMNSQQGSLGY